ncbi:bactofilin family protein [Pseudoxanthomonas koreensis]|uniref:bactofilin family protein n=1 Tax=Pseudoxanthomonas koreensis TaxID=266061 RepID=UPI001391D6BE|nr:polymer-forming cytoskeletal protein [Pseudoxanthomonas koreensis]KAF1690885.1 cell shape determination protein CcmA [Pseudoxanthomonas koreensis]
MSVFKNNKTAQRDGFTIDTLIGPDVVIRGDLEFSGGLYVEGRIVGKVLAAEGKPASLVLAEQGMIEGEVHAPVVIVNGTLNGDVHAGERIELAQKARVEGNVHYTVVEMSAGAQLTGRLVHASSQPRVAAVPEAATPITAAKAAKA